MRRFEELAGFRLVGVNGQLLLGGIPSRTFDDIARAVPGLSKSVMGGRAMSKRAFRVAGKLVGGERGNGGGIRTAMAGAGAGAGAEDEVTGTSSAVSGTSGTSNGLGEEGGATGLNGLLRMPNLYTLDDRPSLAFAPRFEAARFLADLLLLSANREDPQVRVNFSVLCTSSRLLCRVCLWKVLCRCALCAVCPSVLQSTCWAPAGWLARARALPRRCFRLACRSYKLF